MDTELTRRETWLRRARRLRLRVNTGWWWDRYLRWAIAGCAVAGPGLLLLRTLGRPLWPLLLGWALWMLLSAGGALWAVRGRFLSLEGALARMDVARKFQHRLVSAWEGACDWPAVDAGKPMPVVWKPASLVAPPLLGLCFLGMGLGLPLPEQELPPAVVRTEPPEWKLLETLAEELRQRDVVEETALEKVEQQVAELRSKAPDTWYRPGSMEATGQLRQQVKNDALTLKDALQQTGRLLAAAAEKPMEAGQEQREAMRELFNEMLGQLGEGGLPLNAAQLQQLARMDLGELQQLNAEQLQQLMDQLQEQADALGAALVAAGMEGDSNEGSGGVGRGGGPTPLSLQGLASVLEPAVPLAVNNPERERAALGDLLDVQQGEHEDAPDTRGGAGGAVSDSGGGGGVVWRSDVLPAEETILKAYFK